MVWLCRGQEEEEGKEVGGGDTTLWGLKHMTFAQHMYFLPLLPLSGLSLNLPNLPFLDHLLLRVPASPSRFGHPMLNAQKYGCGEE